MRCKYRPGDRAVQGQPAEESGVPSIENATAALSSSHLSEDKLARNPFRGYCAPRLNCFVDFTDDHTQSTRSIMCDIDGPFEVGDAQRGVTVMDSMRSIPSAPPYKVCPDVPD
jgi:hypothetical protein